MSSQRSRAAAVRLAAVAVVLLLVSLLVVGNSRAAFTDTAGADGAWSAATVSLTESADGVLFDAGELTPGEAVSQPVTVTYEGSAASVDVRLYGDGLVDNGLADHLHLTVEVAGSTVYDGALTAFATTHADFDSGADAWDDAGPDDTRTYDVTVTLDEGTPDDAQGADASISFVWEAQSN